MVLPGSAVGKDWFPLRSLQSQLSVDVVGKEVGDVRDLGQVVTIFSVKDPVPDPLLVLVAQPVATAVQLRVWLDQMSTQLIP